MAGIADNYDVTKTRSGAAGRLYIGVEVPAAAGRLTLDAGGSGAPDSTASSGAIHLGMTKEGAVYSVKQANQDIYADEFHPPIDAIGTQLEASIQAEILAVEDWDIMAEMGSGFATNGSGAGYEENTIGTVARVFKSVALTWPLQTDPTKFGVMQLYKAYNEAGWDSVIHSLKTQGSAKINLKGYAISTRAAADLMGNCWKQT